MERGNGVLATAGAVNSVYIHTQASRRFHAFLSTFVFAPHTILRPQLKKQRGLQMLPQKEITCLSRMFDVSVQAAEGAAFG